jgi:hypothetical protein
VVVTNQSGDFWKKSLQVRKRRPGFGFKIWKIWYTAVGAVTATHQDVPTALSAPADQMSAGANQTLYFIMMIPRISPLPFGNASILNLSAPVQLSGTVYVTRG